MRNASIGGRRARVARIVALAVAAQLVAPLVRADEPAASTTSRPARAPASGSSPSSDPAPRAGTAAERAERLAARAFDQATSGAYADAVSTYLEAYEAARASVVLLNVAILYDHKLHERELAAEYYRRYLRAADAEPPLVKKATDRLAALKREADDEASAKAAASAKGEPATGEPATGGDATANAASAPNAPAAATSVATPTPTPTPSPAAPSDVPSDVPTPPRPRTARTVAVVTGSVGVAGVAASLVLGLVAKNKNDEANATCDGRACASDRGVSLAREAGTFATASTVTFVSGAALVAAGAALYFLAPRGPSGHGASVVVGPHVGARDAGLLVEGRF